jgi:hypothetical protein
VVSYKSIRAALARIDSHSLVDACPREAECHPSFKRKGLASSAILHQFEAQQQPKPASVAQDAVATDQSLQA